MIIVGTGGGLYQDQSGAQAASIFDLLSTTGARTLFECSHAEKSTVLPPTRTSGKSGVELTALGHMSAAYTLMDAAVPKWTFYDYDWRLDIRHNGQLLRRYLVGQAPTGDRWHVVCHSQGGLVLLWAASLLGAEFAKLVRSVVFVGVPFFGTINSAQALLDGYFINKSIPRQLARTWPSLYQMLPRWGAVTSSKEAEMLLNSTWSDAGLWPSDLAKINRTKSIDPFLLRRAQAWDRALPVSRMFEPLRTLRYVRIVHGLGRDTALRLPGFPETSGALMADGDTLVPDEQTLGMLPSWVRNEATIKRFNAAAHSLLCSDANVYDWCIDD